MPRTQLRPFSSEDILALIDGTFQCEQQLGLRVDQGLRDFFVSGEISQEWLDRLRSSKGANPWMHGFAVVEGGTVVGTAGFKGSPDDEGVVEIAYGIVPSRQGRGYATESANALVEFASKDPRVKLIRAHTLPEPNASTRVLAKCLFSRVGDFEDPEDGLVWRWEREPK